MGRRLKLFAPRPLLDYLSDADADPSLETIPPLPPLLSTPEILRLIIQHLNAPALSALACCRPGLMAPVSRQLYKTLDSKQLEKLANRFLTYAPAPDPGANARVDRFRQLYAHHIQHLHIMTHSTRNSDAPISIWKQLQRLMLIWPTEALFPNLRSLTCTADEPEHVETMLKLLVASLEELNITGSSLSIGSEQD
ncbi:hypothetical protein DACRYDRAFT_107648 [Dacryopinax primogenitus]|uniref:F-box domain-containing protein n=1 Tax=Dacryopinax primogenitus (strain DJM 731) TaxID=1858805 RepID=M5GCQ4_DACPD|nr:uncharacterized protein DACRYDRAFT_107648 [Dacryopinax primogenitus]EJU01913.1 hypothetical protein DACRYDRAFT_107648 [Dacryopinax primogenitus]